MPRKFELKNVFDTSFLYRGSYEVATDDRIFFHLKFSTPEKRQIVKGTIGTTVENEFEFDERLLKVKVFNVLLDPRRIKIISDTRYKYCSYISLIQYMINKTLNDCLK